MSALRAGGERVSMAVERDDMALQEGCDARCGVFRYRSVDVREVGVRTIRRHSWKAHNEYEQARIDGRRVIAWDGLCVDLDEHTVVVDGVRLDIESGRHPSIREWTLLRILARHVGCAVSQEHLLLTAWGEDYRDELHLLRVCVARLRRKLDPQQSRRFIETLPGVGYRMGRMAPADDGASCLEVTA